MALCCSRRTFSNLEFKKFKYFFWKQIYIQRGFSTQIEDIDKLKPSQKIESKLQSIQMRGYLRKQKSYNPPDDVPSLIKEIYEKQNFQQNITFYDQETKFKLLKECSKVFNHSIPSYLLHKINHFDDLLTFYQTPVLAIFPLDEMKNLDLPKNLHVLNEYVRFHPETDTKFGGISAFPENSTVMSDVKAKKKYRGYEARKKSLK